VTHAPATGLECWFQNEAAVAQECTVGCPISKLLRFGRLAPRALKRAPARSSKSGCSWHSKCSF